MSNTKISFTVIMDAMLKMPYHKNDTVNSTNGFASHEDAISTKFNEFGYKQWDVWDKFTPADKTKFRIDNCMSEWTTNHNLSVSMPECSYIRQPFGTQSAPDFILKLPNKSVLAVEAKSTTNKSCSPMWNSCIPKHDTLYVFSSQSKNETTMFMGGSVISSEYIESINEHIKKCKIRDDKFNNTEMMNIKDGDSTRGFAFYTRVMIIQQGGHENVNYFDHVDRERSEQYAINWVDEKERVYNG
jgi:hypothetical protein